ncbi:MAG: hypothetical protein VXW45_04555 [Pseudomonadota bacterium]|nr:hypothetical protein [Pseudomonadota bacterium]
MDHRSKNLTLHVLLVILACASTGLLFAQSSKQYQSFRTEYGHPDLQGVWNFSSNIPMQRDQRFGVREFLAPDELQEVRARLLQEAAQAAARASEADDSRGAPPKDTSLQSWISYNDFWEESAGIGEPTRTSHIIYPANGRLPEAVNGNEFLYSGRVDIQGFRPVRFVIGGIGRDGPEDRGLSSRCLVGFNAGPPFVPSRYNNNVQIFQGKDAVVIMTEMIHDARIVPLGNEKHLDDSIRLWSGDSRGWWEGETLVVQTKNFNGLRQTFNFTGSNKEMILTERFTRLAYDQLEYAFTIDDPATFSDKISAVVPMTKVAGQIYEYACHEGNYAMTNILRGARIEEELAGDSGVE